MLTKTVKTRNITNVVAACDALIDRNKVVPGLGLVYSPPGYGKTTACEFLLERHPGGVAVRCFAVWTLSAMLSEICAGLRLEPSTRPSKTVQTIIDFLTNNPRPIVVDEIDHLFAVPRLLETLRDIHDKTLSPIIFVGMAGVDRKFLRHPQIHRRITQSIELAPLDFQDLKLVADTICQVKLADDLLTHLLDRSRGVTGYAVVGLSQIERYCAGSKLVTLADWEEQDKPLFLGSRVM
jgi:DNA transposition AAA+ family ATPase